jgi:hypothetical protein
MPKIGNPISSEDIPCERCHSKRKVSKKWTEKIENTGGFMVIEHTQIICTNKECQAEFDKTVLADAEKREKLKQTKIDGAAKRAAEKVTA